MVGRVPETGTEHPRVFVSYAHDSERHKTTVLEFASFLRDCGIDARLDQWAEDQRRDWSLWAVEQVKKADFVLVIASPAYKRRAEDGVAYDDGRGVQFEASLLRERLCADRNFWLPRLLPVVLPGRSAEEIPLYFQPFAASHYIVGDFTEDGAGELLSVLRSRPRRPMPELGPVVAPPAPTQPPGIAEVWRSRRDPDQDQVVDDLAQAEAAQWRHEEERRSVLDTPLLNLRWSVTAQAEAAMAGVSWESLGLVKSRSLAGDLSQAGGLIGRVPSRRLVILGGSGSGKSMFAIRLVRDLLAVRHAADPVPVLLPMGAWNPGAQRLPDWMAARLIQDHPGLRRKVRSATGDTRTLAASLVESGRILPVLDGLDEISKGLRPAAIHAINRLGADLPLIVTSRDADYLDAVVAAGRGLAAAVAVELHPLEPTQVANYLLQGDTSTDRWQPVLRELRDNSSGSLSRALQVPLMVWLARTIYADPATDPGELCRLPNRDAVEGHLLDHLIAAGYPSYPTPATRKTAFRTVDQADVGDWLSFLARHLRATESPDLAWWRLQRTVSPIAPVSRFLTGATFAFGLGQMNGMTTGLVLAGPLGLLAMSERFLRFSGVDDLESPHTFQFNTRRVRHDLRTMLIFPFRDAFGILLMDIVAAVAGSWSPQSLLPNLVLLVLFLFGLGHALWFLVRRSPAGGSGTVTVADPDRVAKPEGLLRSDRAVTLLGAVPFAAIGAIFLLAGLPGFAVLGATFGLAWIFSSAYFRFVVTRFVLALRGRQPWRLMTFLADARERGVLRQVGVIYQFRHSRLQERLAERTA